MAGNVAGDRAHQEFADTGQFFQADEHAFWHRFEHDFADHLLRAHLVFGGGGGNLLVDQRRFDVGGADGIDGDVGVSGFQRHHFREAEQTVLGGDIGRLERRRHQRVDRTDIDDAAETAITHARQHRLGHPGGAGQHDVDQLRPFRHRKLFQTGNMLDAGVIDQHINLRLGLHQGLNVGVLSDIEFIRPDTTGRVGRCQFADGVESDIGCDNRMACICQLPGDAFAYAAAGAGDQNSQRHGALVGCTRDWLEQ